MDSFVRRATRRTVKPVIYGAIDAVFPYGIQRTVDGERLRLGMQASRFYPSSYEPEKADFLRAYCRPGTTAIDVGAHFGVFTVIMARAAAPGGRVVAFEPTPSTREALKRTIAHNGCAASVTIRGEAVSIRDGEHRLFASEFQGDMGNSLIAHGSGVSTSLPVATVALDSLFSGESISCIKIDAEGSELDILRGAQLVLRSQRPALTVEVHPAVLAENGQAPGEIWDLLHEYGYRLTSEGTALGRNAMEMQSSYFELQAVAGVSRVV